MDKYKYKLEEDSMVEYSLLKTRFAKHSFSNNMPSGKVKFYLVEKGFGFVIDTESGQEFFFHKSSVVNGPINADDAVTFSIEEGKKGLEAREVVKN